LSVTVPASLLAGAPSASDDDDPPDVGDCAVSGDSPDAAARPRAADRSGAGSFIEVSFIAGRLPGACAGLVGATGDTGKETGEWTRTVECPPEELLPQMVAVDTIGLPGKTIARSS
jgi:hypothetical protein